MDTAPASVQNGVRAVLAYIALGVVSTVLTIIFKDQLIDDFCAARSGFCDDSTAPAYVASAVIGLVIFGGLLGLLVFFALRRANWARITLIVIAVLSVLGALVGLIQKRPIYFDLISVLQAIAAIAVIYFFVQRDAKAYYQKS